MATLMASLITGQAGINPMEIFAIIIFIAIRFILGLFSIQIDIISSLLIAGVIAVACGYAGDTLFDYKAGEILGTNPKAQLVAQVIGGIVGAVTATATIFVVINQYGPVGSQSLPAPQGLMVYSMVGGTYNPAVFWIAAAIGAILVLLKVPSITLGIGIYLSFGFSLAIFLGGLIQYIVKKLKKNKTGNNGLIIASGLFGGESLIGVLIPIIKMFTE